MGGHKKHANIAVLLLAVLLLALSVVGVLALVVGVLVIEPELGHDKPLVITLSAIAFFVLAERIADVIKEKEANSSAEEINESASVLRDSIKDIPSMLSEGGQLVVFSAADAQNHINYRAQTATVIKNTSLRYNTRKYDSHAENVLAWISIKLEIMKSGVALRELVSTYVRNDPVFVDFMRKVEAARQEPKTSGVGKVLERFVGAKTVDAPARPLTYEVAYIDDVLHPLIQLTHLRFGKGHSCVYFGWQYMDKDANKVFYSENQELADFLESYFDTNYRAAVANGQTGVGRDA